MNGVTCFPVVPVLVKRLDQDKNADENVDADLVRTGRPVESEQSIGLFTQGEDRVIDFRVSGLPNTVVKKAENFSVRELVRKIEGHPQRRERQADFLQPIQWRTKVMNREMGNVKLFELCETIPKMRPQEIRQAHRRRRQGRWGRKLYRLGCSGSRYRWRSRGSAHWCLRAPCPWAHNLCRVWHSPDWPCSRSWSCTGDLSWNSRQALG